MAESFVTILCEFFAGCRGGTLRNIAMLATVLLSACTLADQFGSRAVNYNIQAENARDQGLLLNIIRAAYRKPMQFSDVTTASGTATATGTIGSSLLLGPHQSASTNSLSPGFTFAGGPTFTMSSLDTKEFYSGILAPISNSLVGYYVSLGIPPQVLYTLLFAEIDVDGFAPMKNNVARQPQWDTFQYTMNALLDAGLTIELKAPDNFGPALSARSLSDPAKLAALAKEKIDLVPGKSGKSATPAVWHAVKDDPKPGFCFDNKNGSKSVFLASGTIHIPDSALCGKEKDESSRTQTETLTTKTLLPGLKVRIRSLEGVIYFLGEIVRSQLGLDQTHQDRINPWICFERCTGDRLRMETDTLFSVRPGNPSPSISTTYDNATYSMPVDPSNADHSAQVLEFAAQLMALSSSSKDLPSPGVVTLIGH
ncbi:MAG: hypothetical protein ABSA58_15960 [Acetobacteraceae bacterium]|jgi:hypothetical protein